MDNHGKDVLERYRLGEVKAGENRVISPKNSKPGTEEDQRGKGHATQTRLTAFGREESSGQSLSRGKEEKREGKADLT